MGGARAAVGKRARVGSGLGLWSTDPRGPRRAPAIAPSGPGPRPGKARFPLARLPPPPWKGRRGRGGGVSGLPPGRELQRIRPRAPTADPTPEERGARTPTGPPGARARAQPQPRPRPSALGGAGAGQASPPPPRTRPPSALAARAATGSGGRARGPRGARPRACVQSIARALWRAG